MNSVNFMDAMNSGKRFRPLGYGKNNPEIWFEMRQDSDFLGEKVLYHVDDNAGDSSYGQIVLGDINGQFELEEREVTLSETEFEILWKYYESCSDTEDPKEVMRNLLFKTSRS